MGQWKAEAVSKTNGSLRILSYYGKDRKNVDLAMLASSYDIVITTYETLERDLAHGSLLSRIKWHRIVNDESHRLRNTDTKTFDRVCRLESDRRWACSGTPVINSRNDFLGQMKAIHLPAPVASKEAFMLHASQQHGYRRRSILNSIVPLISIAHTKEVLQLPDKHEEHVECILSDSDFREYGALQAKICEVWQALRAQGPACVRKNMLAVLTLLHPLRRMCSGGRLTAKERAVPACGSELLQRLSAGPGPSADPDPSGDDDNADGDNTDIDDPLLLLAQVAEAEEGRDEEVEEVGVEEFVNDTVTVYESKLLVVMENLREICGNKTNNKVLVFTAFTSTLAWLEQRLSAEGIGHCKITGRMTAVQRTQVLQAFDTDPNISVFLLTVNAGAVGINITAANNVFLLEPSVNSAIEDQAIGRAWRMGQTRPVYVKRFYVKDSVEESIVQIASQRRGDGGTALRNANVRSESVAMTMSELDMLFGFREQRNV